MSNINQTISGDKTVKMSSIPPIVFTQKKLESLYGNVNESRSHDYIYGYLSRSSGYLYRKLDKSDVVTAGEFIRPMSWLFALGSKLGVNVESALLRRYPDSCPKCLSTKICVCSKTNKKPEGQPDLSITGIRQILEERAQSIIYSNRIITFDRARSMISSIYPQNAALWTHSRWFHFAKTHEEVAEIHEAYCNVLRGTGSKEELEEEFADVLAWLIGAWDIALPNISLDVTFNEYYRNGCPVCFLDRCNCPPYHSRAERLFDPTRLVHIRNLLEELMTEISLGKEEVANLITVIDGALTKSDFEMRMALGEIGLKLDYLDGIVVQKNDKANEVMNKARFFMKSLSKIQV